MFKYYTFKNSVHLTLVLVYFTNILALPSSTLEALDVIILTAFNVSNK